MLGREVYPTGKGPGAPTRRRSYAAAAAALLLVLATAAAAPVSGADRKPTVREQLKEVREAWIAAGRPSTETATLEPKFGVDTVEFLDVHAYDFQANTSSDLIMDDGNGYRYFGAPAVPYMAAPVALPAGVDILAMQISYCAENVGDLVFGLYDNGVGGSGSAGGTPIGLPVVSGAGCSTVTVQWPSVSYTDPPFHPLYVVVFFAGGGWEGATKFNSISIAFQRKVSPPPATATFDDVPTSDFGYQFVEALAASGISGGCGSGNYCPDAPVTRRQMAIFLAKALGLAWGQ